MTIIHNSNFVEIDFVGGIAKLKNIYQLLKEFNQEGLNLSIEAIEQEPQEYIDYSQDEETTNPLDEIDTNRINRLVFSGNEKTLVNLRTIFESGKLSEKLGVKVLKVSIPLQVKLSNWFQGVFEAGFQALSTLIDEEKKLAYNLRSLSSNESVSGGRIIDLGLTINKAKVALIINISPDEEDKRNIQVQLYPSGKGEFLPPNIKLVMLTAAGRVLQEIESRRSDKCIQLLPFKNKIGKSFTLQIKLEDQVLSEDIFVI